MPAPSVRLYSRCPTPMEGNFYVSPDRIKGELKSELGKSYLQCRAESALYAQCVEMHHVNKSVKKDKCKDEREQLDGCVDRVWKATRSARKK